MNSEDYDLAELIKDSFGNHSYYLNGMLFFITN